MLLSKQRKRRIIYFCENGRSRIIVFNVLFLLLCKKEGIHSFQNLILIIFVVVVDALSCINLVFCRDVFFVFVLETVTTDHTTVQRLGSQHNGIERDNS